MSIKHSIGGAVLHRKCFIFAAMIVLLLVVFAAGNAWPRDSGDLATANYGDGMMHPDSETLLQWIEQHKNAPEAHIDEGIRKMLKKARDAGQPTSLSLMQYLPWNSSNMNLRAQGICPDCFVWASTGIMEIAHSVQNGVNDQLSVQFFDSCFNFDCSSSGGTLAEVASWYSTKGYAIPWSNANAAFVDGNNNSGTSLMPCVIISSFPNYSIELFQLQSVHTGSINFGVDQETSIANIKNILNQNKGVTYNFCLANSTDWQAFQDFWKNEPESVLWNANDYCGHTWDNGVCHVTLIVGYNDDDPNPANQYWIVLNSQGNAPVYGADNKTIIGYNRPNGLFSVPIYMNYDCLVNGSGTFTPLFKTTITFGGEDNNIPPVASTSAATNVTLASATLNGVINPNGASTTYTFEYGTTTAYGNTTTVQLAGNGTAAVPLTANLIGLMPMTQYHYDLTALSPNGTSSGFDMTFTTTAVSPPPPSQQYTLVVTMTGTGNGTITSSPNGINCGSDCSMTYQEGKKVAKVTLKEEPDAYSTFLGWGGDCQPSGTKKTCTLNMNSDKNATASFGLPEISVSPTSYDFGDVGVKKSSASALFTTNNNGTGNLTVTKIAVTGGGAQTFKMKGHTKETIPPGGSYQFTITFKPTFTGTETATVQITSNDPATPTSEISIVGNGI